MYRYMLFFIHPVYHPRKLIRKCEWFLHLLQTQLLRQNLIYSNMDGKGVGGGEEGARLLLSLGQLQTTLSGKIKFKEFK